ncbi:S1C family serine protease [Nocardioides massiliensis]|uniref:Serine protease PepD n=1 Tax=Nocardioides massiliensis TaxID=1325935 RepID=A0ABT9NUN9_9ACTN|nr:trypsin-like peptidase domain-containing protein [Nocardioides massiliensis]MDP9824152.1 putative serine protease PepD [Nocardioides massiliensis]
MNPAPGHPDGTPDGRPDDAHLFAPYPSPLTQAYAPPALRAPAEAPRTPRFTRATWAWLGAGVVLFALVAGAAGAQLGGGGGGLLELETRTAVPLPDDNGSVAAVADELLPSTLQIAAQWGEDDGATGSGFVLDEDGHVITNNHVVADAARGGRIAVIDASGERYQARIIGRSETYDIAVLRVRGLRDARPAAIGASQQMRVGETVVAIGSPLGLGSTVTSGIISALDRPVTAGPAAAASYINAVQTDAAINPGNSGGPLVNLQGQVVGVNSAIATAGGFGGGRGSIGVGFAIPIEQVQITADQILRTGEARYPVIGANVDVRGNDDGARVAEVPASGPAAEAGLQPGDLVTRVEGTRVTDGVGLIVAIRSRQPGETVTLTVERGDEELELQIELDSQVG